jgi:hypothetical protein
MSDISPIRSHPDTASVELGFLHEVSSIGTPSHDSEAESIPLPLGRASVDSSLLTVAPPPVPTLSVAPAPYTQTKDGDAGSRKRGYQRIFLKSWFYELAAVVISILSFQAAIGLMVWANGKALSNWHFRYSINTIVSILTITSRTTLAFVMSSCLGQQKWNLVSTQWEKLQIFEQLDAASRGPLGALRLFISLKFR